VKLIRARIQDYRSVHDSGEFEVEASKTLLVGVNEAGKTGILRALQTINPPDGSEPLEALRDYPRSRYTEIQSGKADPSNVEVAEAVFKLDPADFEALAATHPAIAAAATSFAYFRHMDNTRRFRIDGAKWNVTFGELAKDLPRLRAHLAKREDGPEAVTALDAITSGGTDGAPLDGALAKKLDAWLDTAYPLIDEDDAKEEERFGRLRALVGAREEHLAACRLLEGRLPLFVYYSTYFTVRPRIQLSALAGREAAGDVDEEYDFGNQCLLKLLAFTAKELSDLASGAPADVKPHNVTEEAHKAATVAHQKRLDERQYALNAAGVGLTKSIREVWGDEQVQLRLVVDGQYLKVVVVDDLGVEVELDQRSEGFRWLVSFFVVFKAQAAGELKNAILLLDEPGLSLHALKQQEFRHTVTRLAADNQIIYTTHSPFMVGTDELDLVRIVEMKDRTDGTKVHTRLAVDDPRSVYPLQAALGYELAQSLFGQTRNLVCEGLTDMFYVEGLSRAFQDAGMAHLKESVALVPAHSASKVLYYCTLLQSQRLKVAALLDSDTAGEKAASQDELVRLLKTKEILRTKDHYAGPVVGPEIEDMLRDTLLEVAKDDLGWDSTATAFAQPQRRTVDILAAEHKDFSKYRLARAFLRWLAAHPATDLTVDEQKATASMFTAANKALA